MSVQHHCSHKPNIDSALERTLAIGYKKVGDIYTTRSQYDTALENSQRALSIYQRLANIDTDNINAKITLAIGLEYLGDAYRRIEDRDTAIGYYTQSLKIHQFLQEKALKTNSTKRRKKE